MKATILIVATLFSSSLGAQVDCNLYAQAAADTMDHRQYRNNLGELLKVAEGSAIVRAMAISAYEQPRYRVQANRRDAIDDFRNKAHLECLRHNAKEASSAR